MRTIWACVCVLKRRSKGVLFRDNDCRIGGNGFKF